MIAGVGYIQINADYQNAVRYLSYFDEFEAKEWISRSTQRQL